MCGIIGIASHRSVVPGLGDWYRRLSHRGPDDFGEWTSSDGRITLGHARLAVQDLSPLGRQPMLSGGGRYVIVFNGEIYNFVELRDELNVLGFRFKSSGDTEVILAAYQAWGKDCVKRFNGMFAFALLDLGDSQTEPSLFFARDRAGEKPLYYRLDGPVLSFASELKALKYSKSIDLQALNHYLALGYVPRGFCLFEGIRKLEPGHCASYSLASGKLDIWQYWQLPENKAGLGGDVIDLVGEAQRLIEDSVRLRMIADVPVGILLSGGLDSSLVACAAARVSAYPIETFTVSLPGSSLDEVKHAKKVADFLGARHHVLPLAKPSLNLLDGLASLIDEPIADSSILPAWLVFGMAQKGVTVALGGDGGDELFGGYLEYKNSLENHEKFKKIPPCILASVARAASALPAGVRGRNKIASLRAGGLEQKIWGGPYFDLNLRRRILSKHAVQQLGSEVQAPEALLLSYFDQGKSPLDKMTRADFSTMLPDDFLVKVDRASMAHSLEVRSPMLDHRLIEFCFSKVPDKWKVSNGETRRLQRLLAKDWLPPDLDTKRKQGFSIPINEWLRAEGESKLMERMHELPEVIDRREVSALVRGHMGGRSNGGRLFALIMLSLAMRNAAQ